MLPWRSFSFKRQSKDARFSIINANEGEAQRTKTAFDKTVSPNPSTPAYPTQSPLGSNGNLNRTSIGPGNGPLGSNGSLNPGMMTPNNDSKAVPPAFQRSAGVLRSLSTADLDRFWETLSAEERNACIAFSHCVSRDLPHLDPHDVNKAEGGIVAQEPPLPHATSAEHTTEDGADRDGSRVRRQSTDSVESIESASQTLAEERMKKQQQETEEILARAVSQVLSGVTGELVAMKNELKGSLGEDIQELKKLLQGKLQGQDTGGTSSLSKKSKSSEPLSPMPAKKGVQMDLGSPKSSQKATRTSEPSTSRAGDQVAPEQDPAKVANKKRRQTVTVLGGTLQMETYAHFEESNPSIHYDIDGNKIGEGSFGSVCIGTKKDLGTKRAIKTVPKSKVLGNEASLWHEIEIMRQLDHPHLLRLFATYEDHRAMYFVTELCTGGELFDAIAECEGGFTEKAGSRLMKQMAQALGYLHARKICHRDVKPENFMLVRKGDISQAQIKLIDLGAAKEFGEDKPMTTKVCTVTYVAPEVLTKQAKAYTELVDIWSLGVVMYIILSGQPPFSGENDMAVMKAIRKGRYVMEPAELWEKVSVDAKDLLSKMLEVNPEIRYSAKQVLNHRWITEVAPEASGAVLTLASRLRAFRSQNKLKKIALQVIAQNLCEEKIDHLKSAFLAIDEDNRGSLKVEQIEEAIKLSGMDQEAVAEVTQVLWEMAAGGNGEVNYTQFLGATISRRQYLQEEAVKAAFNIFDLDGDGHITKEELATVLGVHSQDSGNNISGDLKAAIGFDASEVDKILQEVDQDGDGEIDFKEFMDMMAKMA